MARVAINTGATPNDGTGDSLRSAGGIINSNFLELYSYLGAGSTTDLSVPIWDKTNAGINTLSNVGVGTTNPRFSLEVGSVGASGTSLWVNGNARVTGILTVGTASITIDGVSNTINVGSGVTIDGNSGTIDATSINIDGVPITGFGVTSITAGSGISVDQNTGNVTITATGGGGGGGESYWTSTTAGIHTLSNVGIGTTNPTSKLTVGGSLNVSGISTLSSNVSVGGTVSVDGGVKLVTNNATIVGTSATTGEIKRIGGAPFFYDGSAWREFVLSAGTPVSVPADTDWDNVILRSTYNTGTNFDDAKFEISPVFVGTGATTVGSPLKYGTRSLKIDGSVGCGLSYAPRIEYNFTGSWTIEFWVYFDSSPTSNRGNSLVSMISSSDSTKNWTFAVYDNGNNTFFQWDNENHFQSKTLYSAIFSTFDAVFLNKWKHIAVVREDDGSLHCYIDGIETSSTSSRTVFDNNIVQLSSQGLHIGGSFNTTINGLAYNISDTFDGFIDDLRISAGVGTAGQRYTSVGINTAPTFTPPTTELPITGTLSSYVQPPGDKYGEITLGGSPTWRGTSGVTVSQQSSGNYRVSFASTYTNSNDYFVLSNAMDQGFASYVGIARSTTHVDLSINKESDDAAVDTGSLSVQIKNHI